MQQFDLKRALDGDPVITRSGRKVTEIHQFQSMYVEFLPVVCVIEGQYHYYNIEGIKPGSRENDNLCMAPVKKTMWINVWANGYGIIISSPKPFESEKLAKDAYTISAYQQYYGAHAIEIEI